MTDPVLAVGEWRTNAHMIRDGAVPLGYLPDPVVDVTYGQGKWWTLYTPPGLVAHDIRTDGVDFRHLPEADGTYATVCLDGPYKLNGTPSPEDRPYGVDVVDTRDGRHRLICDGITEAARVVRPGGYVLVKCQDQVNGGRVRWQSRIFSDHAEVLGLRLADALLFRAYRPQPADRRQVHARRNYSTLLVLHAPKGYRPMRHARPDYDDRIIDTEQLIPDDEPVLLIRGQDRAAPATARAWADINESLGGDPEMSRIIRAHAIEIEEYQRRTGRSKLADMPPLST